MHLYIYVSFLPHRNFEKRNLVTPLWDTEQPEPPRQPPVTCGPVHLPQGEPHSSPLRICLNYFNTTQYTVLIL
jgi:hypothetical protein